ncbi:MAG TPA: NUDIX domain-containing protein [Acidimicrobiales bacterium]|nr:NUDIX domain-containing protein [Acidimicrobiales bacterium]
MSRRGGQVPQDRRGPAGLVEAVRGAVAGHVPTDAREGEARRRILDSLDQLPRPFDEDADPVHVTGSAVVVGRRGTVLHRHKRLHRWMQPGGHVDPGEAPWDAALRESQEETGLVVRHPAEGPRLVHVDVHEAAHGHTHLDLRYLLLAPDEDPAPPPGESPEARWYTWDEARDVADEALAGALEVARRQPEAQSVAGPEGDGPGGGRRSDVGRGGGEGR